MMHVINDNTHAVPSATSFTFEFVIWTYIAESYRTEWKYKNTLGDGRHICDPIYKNLT